MGQLKLIHSLRQLRPILVLYVVILVDVHLLNFYVLDLGVHEHTGQDAGLSKGD